MKPHHVVLRFTDVECSGLRTPIAGDLAACALVQPSSGRSGCRVERVPADRASTTTRHFFSLLSKSLKYLPRLPLLGPEVIFPDAGYRHLRYAPAGGFVRRNGNISLTAFVVFGLLFSHYAKPQPGEDERTIELLAVDERAGRAVFIDVAGATEVLRVDEETPGGLRLKSVTHGVALLDVRFKSSGDVIAYRIAIGETAHIRPLPKHRSGGVRVMTTPLEGTTPKVRTGAKEIPQSAAKD